MFRDSHTDNVDLFIPPLSSAVYSFLAAEWIPFTPDRRLALNWAGQGRPSTAVSIQEVSDIESCRLDEQRALRALVFGRG